MKKSEDLKSLLEQLKTETSYMEDASHEDDSRQVQPQLAIRPVLPKMSENTKAYSFNFKRSELKDLQTSAKFNTVWSENKESLLFCMLASACVILTGVLSQKEYVVLAGTISFVLFSIVAFSAFFRYVSALSSRSLLAKNESQRYYVPTAMSADKEKELEYKIDELRSIIKTLLSKHSKNI